MGSYETTDGQTRQTADLNFAFNPIHSQFMDHIQLNDEQKVLLTLSRSGRLRELREAAARSGDLTQVLKQYAQADNRLAQLDVLDTLILNRAKTDYKFNESRSPALQVISIRSTDGFGSGVSSGGLWTGRMLPDDLQKRCDTVT